MFGDAKQCYWRNGYGRCAELIYIRHTNSAYSSIHSVSLEDPRHVVGPTRARRFIPQPDAVGSNSCEYVKRSNSRIWVLGCKNADGTWCLMPRFLPSFRLSANITCPALSAFNTVRRYNATYARAITFSKPGDPAQVLECRTAREPLPQLGECDVQIRTLLSPVNPADVRVPVF